MLVHLDIRDNWIGDQGAVAFAKAFESNSTLKYFDVGMVIEMRKRLTLMTLKLTLFVIQE